MARKDPYEILGLARSASQDEIKSAYRKLAKQFHPDRNPGDPSAETRFKEVQAAYEVLGDAQRRAQYDRFGAGGEAPNFRSWGNANGGGPRPGHYQDVQFDEGSFGDLSSIFEQFFSRGATRSRRSRGAPQPAQSRGQDLEHDLTISFEESLAGTTREIRIDTGEQRPERIEFRVPAGVEDRQRIRLKGKGQPGLGGRGDLLIRVHVMPHAHFRRDGLNILLDLPLSITEAALGAKVQIPTLDGATRLTVPPGSSTGTKLRLRGKGIRDPRSGESGDLLAVVRVHVPRELSSKARELLEQLQQEIKDDPRAALEWPA